MKIHYYFLALIFSTLSLKAKEANYVSSKKAIITVANYLSPITVKVFADDSNRTIQGEPIFISEKIGEGDYEELEIPMNKKSNTVWVQFNFQNQSEWRSETFEIRKNDNIDIIVESYNNPSEKNPCDKYLRVTILDNEDLVLSYSNIAKIQNDDCQFRSLRDSIYGSTYTIHEANFPNANVEGNEVVWDLLGSLSIIRSRKDKQSSNEENSGEKVRINYIQANKSGRTLKKDQLARIDTIDQRVFTYVFRDTFLVKQREHWLNLIPGIPDKLDKEGKFYELIYKINDFRKFELNPYEDNFDQRWIAMNDQSLHRVFLEAYIHAIRSSSNNEEINVMEYDILATYKNINFFMREYRPTQFGDNEKYVIAAKDGLFTKVIPDLPNGKVLPGAVLFIGTSPAAKDHTDDVKSKADEFLEQLDYDAKKTDLKRSIWIRDLKNLNYPGFPYPQVRDFGDYRDRIRKIRNELNIKSKK